MGNEGGTSVSVKLEGNENERKGQGGDVLVVAGRGFREVERRQKIILGSWDKTS